MVVHTKAAGRTTIKVTVRRESNSFGQFEGSVLELSDEIQILVSTHLSPASVNPEAAAGNRSHSDLLPALSAPALSHSAEENPGGGAEDEVLAAKPGDLNLVPRPYLKETEMVVHVSNPRAPTGPGLARTVAWQRGETYYCSSATLESSPLA